jgi:hypothetical protein
MFLDLPDPHPGPLVRGPDPTCHGFPTLVKSTLLRAGGAAGVPARALVCGDQLCADAAHRIQRHPDPSHGQGKDRRKWDTYRLSVKGFLSRD